MTQFEYFSKLTTQQVNNFNVLCGYKHNILIVWMKSMSVSTSLNMTLTSKALIISDLNI